MGFTRTELDDFHEFAETQLGDENGSTSLEECLRRWQAIQKEHRDSVAAIHESIADEEAGRVRPLSVIVDEMRRERGYST